MPASPDSFLACLRQSELLEPARIDEVAAAVREAGGAGAGPAGAKKLAEAFVRETDLTRWQAEKVLAGRCRGFRLGSYRLLSMLGKGGMSSVYLAEHTVMHRRCAVKVLPTKLLGGGSHLDRFLREARAVAALDHPNIVRAFDMAQDGEGSTAIHFLVMELVEGRSLYDLVKRDGAPPPERVRDIGRQAALGLAHAHAAGLVHRDVKPGNILLAKDGTVKVTDLGLARGAADEEHSLTVAHDEKVLGTADYLAPEQALDSHAVDLRADVYGLGCSLYFALAGHPPFTEGTLAQRLMAHQTKPIPPIRSLREEVPEALAAAVTRMLEKNPDDRFQDMAAVAAALSGRAADDSGGSSVIQEAAAADADLGDFLQNLRDEPDGATGSFSKPRSGITKRSAARKRQRPDAADAATPTADDEPTSADAPAGEPDAGPPGGFPDFSALAAADAGPGDGAAAGGPAAAGDAPFPDLAASPAGPRAGGASAKRPAAKNTAEANSFTAKKRPEENSSAVKNSAGRGAAGRKVPLRPATLAGLAAAGVAVAAVLLLRGGERPDDHGPDVELGSAGEELTVGDGGDFPTFAAVLDHLRTGYDPAGADDVQVVRLLPGTLAEALVIENTDFSFPDGVTFTGGGEVTLDPPGQGPALALSGTLSRLTIEGVSVKADRRGAAVRLSGYFRDVALADLTLTGVDRTGIAVEGLSGKDVVIRDLTARGTADGADVVRLAASNDGGPDGVGGLSVERCTVTGSFRSGVAATADLTDVTVAGSIFSGGQAGVRFEGGGKLKDVRVENCTFHELARGVVFAAPPAARGSGGLVFRRNLFASVRDSDLSFPGDDAGPIRSKLDRAATGVNWTTKADAADPLKLFAGGATGATVDFRSTTPGTADYLSPTGDAPGAK